MDIERSTKFAPAHDAGAIRDRRLNTRAATLPGPESGQRRETLRAIALSDRFTNRSPIYRTTSVPRVSESWRAEWPEGRAWCVIGGGTRRWPPHRRAGSGGTSSEVPLIAGDRANSAREPARRSAQCRGGGRRIRLAVGPKGFTAGGGHAGAVKGIAVEGPAEGKVAGVGVQEDAAGARPMSRGRAGPRTDRRVGHCR